MLQASASQSRASILDRARFVPSYKPARLEICAGGCSYAPEFSSCECAPIALSIYHGDGCREAAAIRRNLKRRNLAPCRRQRVGLLNSRDSRSRQNIPRKRDAFRCVTIEQHHTARDGERSCYCNGGASVHGAMIFHVTTLLLIHAAWSALLIIPIQLAPLVMPAATVATVIELAGK